MNHAKWTSLAEPTDDGRDAAMVVREAGLSVMPHSKGFMLADLQRPLDFVPKNKPFLLADTRGVPREADALLAAWPAALEMARRLLVALYPCRDPRFAEVATVGGCYGCKTDDVKDFGHVYASTTSPVGFVEGIVASLANWKLYASGVAHDRWSREWLDLSDDARYPMPLRPDELVPAANVIHHAYCCAHILAYHQHLLLLPERPRGAAYGARTAHGRVAQARATIVDQLLPAAGVGAGFLTALVAWQDRLLGVLPPTVGV